MSRRWTLVAVVVPVLGLAALIGRAEFARGGSESWTIPIEGYDPRDLIHGQYLQFQYRWNWRGEDACGWDEHNLNEGCCLCLTPNAADGFDPFVRQVECRDVPVGCAASVRAASVRPPQRYFVPEERARDIEQGVRDHAAAIEIVAQPGGDAVVRELMLDRKPWRDVLGP